MSSSHQSVQFCLRRFARTVFAITLSCIVLSCSKSSVDSSTNAAAIPIVGDENSELHVSPNPARLQCTLRFSVPTSTSVHLSVRTEDWRLVRTVIDDQLAAGNYAFDLTLSDLSAGYYYAVLDDDGKQINTLFMIAH